MDDLWEFPKNVFLIKNGKKVSVQDQAKLFFLKKAFLFFSFTFIFLRACRKYKPKTILVYDYIPLLSYHIAKRLLKFKHSIWYHSHDVADLNLVKKYSIGWWALKAEHSSFIYLDIFSLPSDERKEYFNLASFKGEYFHIPNFPSFIFYSKFKKSVPPADIIKLIYQGSISPGHGIEEVMDYMHNSEKKIKLILIGNIKESYKNYLANLFKQLNIERSVEILDAVNYSGLPPITASAHIGLAIHKADNIVYATGGTASNKIYEYAASGLPVLYYDNEHYKTYLSKYSWALCNDLSVENFDRQIEYIYSNYESLSLSAQNDFKTDLNFEKVFQPVLLFLQNNDN
jgi:hypothetical protein